jgi:hypothetical protein
MSTDEDRCRQTGGNIGSCKLCVTELGRSPAVHLVVLVNASVLEPFLASGELVDEDGLRKVHNLNTNNN